jgi:hypothetical protein
MTETERRILVNQVLMMDALAVLVPWHVVQQLTDARDETKSLLITSMRNEKT